MQTSPTLSVVQAWGCVTVEIRLSLCPFSWRNSQTIEEHEEITVIFSCCEGDWRKEVMCLISIVEKEANQREKPYVQCVQQLNGWDTAVKRKLWWLLPPITQHGNEQIGREVLTIVLLGGEQCYKRKLTDFSNLEKVDLRDSLNEHGLYR